MPSALFDVNDDGQDQGYVATSSEPLSFKLRSASVGVSKVLFQVFAVAGFDPSQPDFAKNPPRASPGAPELTLDNGAGSTGQSVQAATPASAVTSAAPASGFHSHIVRCVVNGGKSIGPNGIPVDDPTLVHERMIVVPNASGIRKIVATERTQYSDDGWADVVSALVDIPPGGGSGDFVGPAGGVADGEIVAFSGTSGKAGQGTGLLAADVATESYADGAAAAAAAAAVGSPSAALPLAATASSGTGPDRAFDDHQHPYTDRLVAGTITAQCADVGGVGGITLNGSSCIYGGAVNPSGNGRNVDFLAGSSTGSDGNGGEGFVGPGNKNGSGVVGESGVKGTSDTSTVIKRLRFLSDGSVEVLGPDGTVRLTVSAAGEVTLNSATEVEEQLAGTPYQRLDAPASNARLALGGSFPSFTAFPKSGNGTEVGLVGGDSTGANGNAGPAYCYSGTPNGSGLDAEAGILHGPSRSYAPAAIANPTTGTTDLGDVSGVVPFEVDSLSARLNALSSLPAAASGAVRMFPLSDGFLHWIDENGHHHVTGSAAIANKTTAADETILQFDASSFLPGLIFGEWHAMKILNADASARGLWNGQVEGRIADSGPTSGVLFLDAHSTDGAVPLGVDDADVTFNGDGDVEVAQDDTDGREWGFWFHLINIPASIASTGG